MASGNAFELARRRIPVDLWVDLKLLEIEYVNVSIVIIIYHFTMFCGIRFARSTHAVSERTCARQPFNS